MEFINEIYSAKLTKTKTILFKDHKFGHLAKYVYIFKKFNSETLLFNASEKLKKNYLCNIAVFSIKFAESAK